jgi:hypothetical protein
MSIYEERRRIKIKEEKNWNCLGRVSFLHPVKKRILLETKMSK